MKFNFQKHKTPVGVLYLVAQGQKLRAVIFQKNWSKFKKQFTELEESETAILKSTKNQLDEYFCGKRRNFELNYELSGTPFQKKVWSALEQIPFGETKSYKQQAVLIKSPKAFRAVGRAEGLNPICIILPCHRVIGSSGAITGYAGGLKVKKALLSLEGISL